MILLLGHFYVEQIERTGSCKSSCKYDACFINKHVTDVWETLWTKAVGTCLLLQPVNNKCQKWVASVASPDVWDAMTVLTWSAHAHKNKVHYRDRRQFACALGSGFAGGEETRQWLFCPCPASSLSAKPGRRTHVNCRPQLVLLWRGNIFIKSVCVSSH